MAIKDLPDFMLGIQAEITNAYLATKAVVENDTLDQVVGDSYETLLNWLTLSMGKKMIFLKNISPGTEDTGLTESDATMRHFGDGAWELAATFVISAEDLLYAHITKVQGEVMTDDAGRTLYYKWTAQRAGGSEEDIVDGSQVCTNAHTFYPYSETVAFDKGIDVDLTIRSYYRGGNLLDNDSKNNKVTYDKKLPSVDYQILTYAYEDKIPYTEATATLTPDESGKVTVSDVYAQVKVQGKASIAETKAKLEVDYIGISL